MVLSWQTASEQEAEKFIVERSENGSTFSPIGSVAAKPQPNAGSHYSFIDNSPLQGVAYYRLKQSDQRSGVHYSGIIRVDRASLNNLTIRVYPNPAHAQVTVQHRAASGFEKVKVHNLSGYIVAQQAVIKNSRQTSLNLAHLPAGNYLLSIVTENQTVSAPFVIH
jgi:trimeric autotransporter adhesin